MSETAVRTPLPSLTRLDLPGTPRALVLLLHGGTEHSTQSVDGRSASWRRMAAVQRSITPRIHEAGTSTWLLRYRERGWNGGRGAVDDVRWALTQVRRELGELPVVLLGHSMGGRAAVHAAGHSQVVGVVGLAPWLPAGESVVALTGKHLRTAHGRADHITSARQTAAYVDRASRVATSAESIDMGRVGHYMFRRVAAWNEVAASQSLAVLRAG